MRPPHNREDSSNWRAHTDAEFFDGMGAFLRRLDELGLPEDARRELNDRSSWRGNLSFDEAKDAAINGVPKLTERVLAVVNRIDADQYLTDAPRMFRPAIVGPLVSVPAYLAGLPDCMLAQTGVVASAQGPVTICVNRCASAGTNEETIMRVGAALCALALTLQRVRPVEIIIASTLGNGNDFEWGGIPFINLGVSPFDADQLAFALAHPAMLRQLQFAWTYGKKGHNGWIPWAWNAGNNQAMFEKRTREYVNPAGDWLYVGGAHVREKTLHENPEQWVKQQIERLTNPTNEGTEND